MKTKQVIVMRKDLKMRKGKEIAQGSHSALAFLTRKLSKDSKFEGIVWFFIKFLFRIVADKAILEWIDSSYAKICLQVNSKEELLKIYEDAKKANLECHLVVDSGKTEFHGVPTETCLCIGPDFSEKIDEITGSLSLY